VFELSYILTKFTLAEVVGSNPTRSIISYEGTTVSF
jgi:hypothetical protein